MGAHRGGWHKLGRENRRCLSSGGSGNQRSCPRGAGQTIRARRFDSATAARILGLGASPRLHDRADQMGRGRVGRRRNSARLDRDRTRGFARVPGTLAAGAGTQLGARTRSKQLPSHRFCEHARARRACALACRTRIGFFPVRKLARRSNEQRSSGTATDRDLDATPSRCFARSRCS